MGAKKKSTCQCKNNKCTGGCQNSGSNCEKHNECKQSGGSLKKRYSINYYKYNTCNHFNNRCAFAEVRRRGAWLRCFTR